MTSHVAVTAAKELRETLRDRRTLAVMVLLPLVVYPMMALLTTQVVATRELKREARPVEVAVSGQGPVADDLRRRIGEQPKVFRLNEQGQAADVHRGRLDALVVVHASEPHRRSVDVVYDAARDESRRAAERLDELLARALPAECLPIDVSKKNLASKDDIGGHLLSKVLPIAVVLMVLLGAFYPAIDVTAGERERGTLETVLSAPIGRFDLLLGKVLAVTAVASLTGLVNLGSISVTLIHAARLAASQVLLPVPWSRAAAAAIAVVPAAFLFAALFVAIGSIARGFKEAQNLLMPVYFLCVAPALIGAVGDYPLSGAAAWVPVMNVTLLVRDMVLGHATVSAALASVASTLLYGGLALALAARIYDSERLLHPEAAPRGADDDAGQGPVLDAPPTAGHALLMFAAGFVLLYFVFVPWQHRSLVVGLLASQWLGMVGLTVLLARATGRPLVAMVALRPPPARSLVGAALVGATAWGAVALLTDWLVPVPKEVVEQLRRAFVSDQHGRGLFVNLLLVALTPAVCEEMFFRGVVLRGLATRLPPLGAAVLTGVLFGLYHLDVWRLLPSTTLGVLLSLLALRSGSLVPAMVAHFLNNAVLVILATAKLDERFSNLGSGLTVAIFSTSIVLTTLGLWLVRRSAPQGGL